MRPKQHEALLSMAPFNTACMFHPLHQQARQSPYSQAGCMGRKGRYVAELRATTHIGQDDEDTHITLP